MQFCSSAGSVLILLLVIFITESESAVPVVEVEYGGTAVLPCTDKCSGVISWTLSHKSYDILAECNQTSCRSVKEGYQMIHDQYLQGDFSLIITEADFSKRGHYTCDCDDKDKCDVELQIKGSESAVTVVEVELNGTAVLPCTESCSGVISWTPSHKSTDILAECNQTSCRSVKEGYQMIHDQYRKGNLFLIITEAGYSKRGRYTCKCDGTDHCAVELQIEPPIIPVEIKPGDSLVMELDVSDPVEVIYISTEAAGRSSGQICTVIGGSLQCKSKYKHRTSLPSSSVLELRGLNKSDRGVYIIRNTKNNEDIYIYTVIMSEGWSLLDIGLIITGVLLLGMLGGMCLVLVVQWLSKKCVPTKKQNDSNQEMTEMI